MSFHALRDYVPGDDRRHIHWKTTARTGQLMVRQFEETRRSHLAVILSTRSEDYGHADEFELAVSSCGSLGLQAIKEDRGSRSWSTTAACAATTASGSSTTWRASRPAPSARASSTWRGLPARASGTRRSSRSCSAAASPHGAPRRLGPPAPGGPGHGDPVHPGAKVSRHRIAELVVLTIGELGDLPSHCGG
ncbi:DUF58 domain-containing protein [Oerskovia sp. M15]